MVGAMSKNAILVLVAVLLAALPAVAHAAPGDLDPTFDGDGMRTFGALMGDVAGAVLVQPDGKLVLAGYGGTDFAVARLNPDGASDTSFDGGMSVADFGGFDSANAAALQPDGKIVVAGHTDVNLDIAIARLHPDNRLRRELRPGRDRRPRQEDLRLRHLRHRQRGPGAAGRQDRRRGHRQQQLRGHATEPGLFDTSFDGDGTAGADFGGADYGLAAALQSDGKIVVAGQAGGDDVAVAP